MASENLLRTDTVNLNDLFLNGRKYRVPIYQRDYSWQEENWDELWDDIVAIRQSGAPHYMGAIVLQSLEDKFYGIIDGQQRLATLSLLALGVIRRIGDLIEGGIEPDANRVRVDLLRNNYLSAKDAVSLHYSSKLFLNENNDSFYQNYLIQLRQPINPRRLSDSDKLLWQASEYFYKKVKDDFGAQVSGSDLADFILNQVAEKLLFIRIIVEDEVNAYTVFETLNARGLELTTTDLLKNYLLSLSSDSAVDQKVAKDRWQEIIRITDLESFPKFLRYYWNSRNNLVTKERLFKVLRGSVKNREQSFVLLDDLQKSAGIYAALEDANDELWRGNKEIRKRVQELNLFNTTQCYPLLMIAYDKLPLPEFERILRACSIISFRYNVIAGKNPNIQEIVYNRAACKIFNGSLTKASQVEQELKEIYLGDEDFVNAFSTKTLNTKRSKKLTRYILYSLENQIANSALSYEDDFGTIEHILPENPGADWEQFFSQDEQPKNVYRIGNLTLLESSKNSSKRQNLSYAEKLPIYHTSKYKMTNTINYMEWTPIQVSSRQEQMARWATAIWRVQYS
ncbi:MAG TPA: DUF262 domain-containing HNH endonuclease family protein [Blastocatellia bacterium]|jgi:uncharacterized protein with ParB-like and HNH nuclease domain|nr:DUF262 domain-containing HNH endonuclease family protein [Blastocatellia bacterium]